MAKKTTDKGTWKEGDLEVVTYVLDGKVVKGTRKKETKPQTKPKNK